MDPLQALQAAYSVQPDSKEQSDLLAQLRENLESHPNYITVLLPTLIRGVVGAHDSLLKRWTLDLLHFGLGRANLPIEKRTELATQSLDVLASVLQEHNPSIVKTAIQCFSTVYPLLFRYLCSNRNLRPMWDIISTCKARILEIVWAKAATGGMKLAALKFMQRVILVQTRGVTDPRLQKPNDPNLALCPADHPFISSAQLEAEGQKLMEGVMTIFYTVPNPDMMTAVVNSWAPLAKQRPALANIIMQALARWTPNAISHFPAFTVRSVEKAVRILLIHFSRNQQLQSTYSQLLNDALAQQAVRMEQAVIAERNRKAAAAAEASRKRSISNLSAEASDAKRQKSDNEATSSMANILTNFDFSSLPNTLITDLIIANLQTLNEGSLARAIQVYRESTGLVPSAPVAGPSTTPPPQALAVKAEPVDPLTMDMGEEEVDYEPEKINEEIIQREDERDESVLIDVDEALKLVDLKLPVPSEISDSQMVLKDSMSRIWDTGKEFTPSREVVSGSFQEARPQDLWMLLLVRMVTRSVHETRDGKGKEKEDDERMEVDEPSKHERVRHILFDYIMTDFPAREGLALTWMNEEWYNDRIRRSENPDWPSNYSIWVQKLVSAYEPMIDARDRTFGHFLLNIPSVPPDTLTLLRELCIEPDRRTVGFTTLRDFVTLRQPHRAQSMQSLLDLTTHQDNEIRRAAINTVKRWVPEGQPMTDMVRSFAQRLLRRLHKKTEKSLSQTNGGANGDDHGSEDGEMSPEPPVQTPYLPEQLRIPADKSEVIQHMELVFALCVKCPDLLEEIFEAYGSMEASVQEAVQELFTPLIRSLGQTHAKLTSIMRSFPPKSESLAFRVLKIFTENERPGPTLVTLVKNLVQERDLDAHFLIPIIAEMDKADIVRFLPRVVSMLNNTPENKQLVKSVFESIVTTPPQTFGSVTSNLPRVRQSELLAPAELMVLLHESEKEIGLKSAIEAIGICFSMADVFRSEILAVVMQQIVDEPVLPVLFLRTVIQAVRTYKSLVGFVSTTLLSRLITKKIWTNPPLWEGFIRCAITIAPASFGALLQLPKDQLRDLVDKQPSLKSGLRDFVLKKGGNKARQAGFLDLFGEEPTPSQETAPSGTPAPESPPKSPTPQPRAQAESPLPASGGA